MSKKLSTRTTSTRETELSKPRWRIKSSVKGGTALTKTSGRSDSAMNVLVNTSKSGKGRTLLHIYGNWYNVKFDGSDARTLFRVLERHFDTVSCLR